MNNSTGSGVYAKRRIDLADRRSVVVIVGAVCGCQTVSFYRQAIGGEMQILTHQNAHHRIARGHKHVSAGLKHKFEVVLQVASVRANESASSG